MVYPGSFFYLKGIMMENRMIRITENDLLKLREAILLAKQGVYRNSVYIQHLEGELDRAEIISAKQIPANVITMNTRVVLTDVSTGDQMELVLVFPEDALKGLDHVSVLAPIGTAIIGYQVGDDITWDTPDGKTELRVEKIVYQPEADGVFD